MARVISRKRHRSNPVGTLLVNPVKSGLSGILARLTGKKHSRKGSRKVIRVRSHSRRRNPLMVNPLMVNPSGLLGGIQKGAQRVVGKLPLVGGLLSGAIGMFGGAVGGAVGVLPTVYAMPYLSPYLPDVVKPVGYTLGGLVLGTLIRLVGPAVPGFGKYAGQLALVTVASGGAVDAYRAVKGGSQSLGDDDMDSLLSGVDIGDAGDPLAATEYADASLADAEYIGGDDLSGEEIAAAELGRRHYGRRFFRNRKPKPPGEGSQDGSESSDHAGQPGRRHGWMIYWLGFTNFQKLAALPENERRQAIAHMRHEARLRARKLLTEGRPATVQEAEMAGLLVA